MRTLNGQLLDALERSGWSIAELLRQSGLEMAHPSLARKLRGELALKTTEAEALAKTLGGWLAFVPTIKEAA